jgi:hypothetical protein
MRLARLTAVALAAFVVAPAAHALPAPKKLKPFLLRADEPAAATFSRTPSFSWSPVRGAKRYEFQLATGPKFGDSQLVWTSDKIKSPVATVPVTLPWMSGTPYGFYARVRALTRSGLSRWSGAYGFNMRWPTVPAALPGHDGLVRWSTVEGATAYQVWYLDAGKVFSTKTNAADQREYYAFHGDASWTAAMHWRVRATRVLSGTVKNELPAVSYGPWSPVFTARNQPVATGPLSPAVMASDVQSSAPAAAHRLTPGFGFSGTNALTGGRYHFFRVVVSTDRDCVNVVYRGGIVAGPGFAPRATGPLDLPKNAEELGKAFSSFLKDGSEGETFGADNFKVTANESLKPAGSGGEGNTPTGGAGSSLPAEQTVVGSIVDLWDTGWPSSRYYWTVVPVYWVLTSDNKVRWYEAEVPQDLCAAGRLLSFGKLSEPVLVASGAPYVSGLSPDGRLQPARRSRPSFYGVPVAAWMPALGADQYEVQWSRKLYPWKAAGNVITVATAAELPLKPGLWYYRVRGLSATLPAGASQLAWSSPARIRISGPRFRVIRGGSR